jgi:peptide/nickel transport system permease protein
LSAVARLPEGVSGASRREDAVRRLARNPTVVFGVAVLALIVIMALCAPWLANFDPAAINPAFRNQLPGAMEMVHADDGGRIEVRHWMGTDSLGRDVASRVVYGARASLIVGVAVAVIAVGIGLVIGLAAGYLRWLDGIVMRLMDGLMAIPAILLAIAVVSLSSAGLVAVIIAIVVPEVPRVVRLVRSIVLTVREEPYVEAAVAAGTPTLPLIIRHILPNTLPPLIVQATYICASAILIEAILSFLGVGIPAETPTWGNIMAEGRTLFRVFPHNILFPGVFLALTVLSVNMLGDGLRDTLDPRMSKRL